jgi:hypothetical protein
MEKYLGSGFLSTDIGLICKPLIKFIIDGFEKKV